MPIVDWAPPSFWIRAIARSDGTTRRGTASLVDTCRIDTIDDDDDAVSPSTLHVALTLQLFAREAAETRQDSRFEHGTPECTGCSVHRSQPILLCSHETWPLTKSIRRCAANRVQRVLCLCCRSQTTMKKRSYSNFWSIGHLSIGNTMPRTHLLCLAGNVFKTLLICGYGASYWMRFKRS